MLCLSQAPLDDSKFLFQKKYFFILDRSLSSKLFSQEIQIRIIIVLPMVDTLIWQTWLNKVFTYIDTHTHRGTLQQATLRLQNTPVCEDTILRVLKR